MRRLYWSALIYMVLGLASGLYYREITKAKDFTDFTQLSVMHTHLLALGMTVFLILLALEKAFALSRTRSFSVFFWLYNAGLVVTVGAMAVHGTRTVLDLSSGAAIAGIAGLGHMLLTAALIAFFVCLYGRVFAKREVEAGASA